MFRVSRSGSGEDKQKIWYSASKVKVFMFRIQTRGQVRPEISPRGAMPSFPLVFDSHFVFSSRIRQALVKLVHFRQGEVGLKPIIERRLVMQPMPRYRSNMNNPPRS